MQHFYVQVPFSCIPEFKCGYPHPSLYVKIHTRNVMVVKEQGI